MTPDPEYRQWIAKAANDYLNIQNNLSAVDIPWDTLCFHAQQCVEKLLKALLIKHGQPLERTHDLAVLLARCRIIRPPLNLAVLDADCQILTAYGVSPRYPDPLFDPAEEEAQEALAALEQVRNHLLALLTEESKQQ